MILLTGASGFVGSKILQLLREMSTQPIIALGRQPGPGITPCDLLSDEPIDIPWNAVERVIHCAAVIPAKGAGDPFDNVRLAQSLLKRLPSEGLKALVQLSSVAVYPLSADQEEAVLREDCEAVPESPYGRAKLTQEWMMQDFARGRTPLTILRPSSIYGSGNTSRTMLPIFVEQARAGAPITLNGSRRYSQNFVHVEDVAEIAVGAALDGREGTFNIFSGETLSPLELARKVVARFGGQSEIIDAQNDAPYPRVTFDNRRLVDVLAFKPAPLDPWLASLA